MSYSGLTLITFVSAQGVSTALVSDTAKLDSFTPSEDARVGSGGSGHGTSIASRKGREELSSGKLQGSSSNECLNMVKKHPRSIQIC